MNALEIYTAYRSDLKNWITFYEDLGDLVDDTTQRVFKHVLSLIYNTLRGNLILRDTPNLFLT